MQGALRIEIINGIFKKIQLRFFITSYDYPLSFTKMIMESLVNYSKHTILTKEKENIKLYLIISTILFAALMI
jgi:hypothetical protein